MPQIVSQQPAGQGPADVCTKGRSCGVACIDRDKECLKNLSPEAAAVARRIGEILRGSRPLGAGGETKDPSADKGLTKIVSSLNKSQKNLDKATAHRKKKCANGTAEECQKAKDAEERARLDHENKIRMAQRVAQELENYTQPIKKRRWSQEQIDEAIRQRDEHEDIQKRIGQVIDKFEARERQIEATMNPAIDPDGYQRAKRQAFKEYQDDLDAAYDEHYQKYPNSTRKNPNDVYVDDEFAEGVFEMLPASVQKNLKNTGSLPEGQGIDSQGIIKLHKGTQDFDTDGNYIGETGEVVAQDRDAKYGKKGRGVAMTESWLRNDGKSIISDTDLDLRDQQGEHYNDHSKHKRGAETYGNLYPAGAAENMQKKDDSMGDYVDKSLNPGGTPKSAEAANAQQSSNNSATAREVQRVRQTLDAPDDGTSRAEAVRNQFSNDPKAQRAFQKTMRKAIDANPNDPAFDSIRNKSNQEILDDYQSGALSGEALNRADFVASHSVIGSGSKARRTYRVVSDDARAAGSQDTLTTDIKKSPRGTIQLGATSEARVVAAAYSLATDAQRQELRNINNEVVTDISKPNNDQSTRDMYIRPMQERLNGQDPTGQGYTVDLSWFPR